MVVPLFDHLALIAQKVAAASHLLVLLDYDGTLTPIVDRPADAELAPATRDVLRSLAQRHKTSVAMLSGRAVEDLQARVRADELIYSGNHGLEIRGPGYYFIRSAPSDMQGKLLELANDLSRRLRHIPGAFVEDKRLTLSVHYRMVPGSLTDELRKVVSLAMAENGYCFRLTSGNNVYEIRPNVDWNKGSAASWIMNSLGLNDKTLTVYLGDDTTDEDAFAVLPDGVNIRVGNAHATTASYFVEGPEDVCRFLQWLVGMDRTAAHEMVETRT